MVRCTSSADGRRDVYDGRADSCTGVAYAGLADLLLPAQAHATQLVWTHRSATWMRPLARFRQLSDHATREAQEITAKIAALSEAENETRLAPKRLIDMASRGRLAVDLIKEQECNLAREAAEIACKKTLLETQLEQAAAGQVLVRDVQGACALLADGLLEAVFEEK